LHVKPDCNVVQPVKPLPPHWPHCAVVQPPVGALVVGLAAVLVEEEAALDVVRVASVVGLAEVVGVVALELDGELPPPPQEKTGGPCQC